MSFFVTRGNKPFSPNLVIVSAANRKKRDGLPYAKDELYFLEYGVLRRTAGIELAHGERKCVELVEVRRPSR